MKWAYSIRQKIKVALLLAIVCLIIVLKNIYDKHNVDELGTTFSSVYEDRLLVESYIYELSGHLYQKKMMLDNLSEQDEANLLAQFETRNAAISTIISDYEKTKFTEPESICFNDFKNNVATLQILESQYLSLAGNDAKLAETRQQLNKTFTVAANDLHKLSDIQVSEGKLLSDNSKKIVAGSSLLTQLELAILIGLAVMIQVLVIASRPIIPKTHQRPSLN